MNILSPDIFIKSLKGLFLPKEPIDPHEESLKKYQEYNEKHKYCPGCRREFQGEVTTAPTIFFDVFGDTNHAHCKCGWKGRVNDLMSETEMLKDYNNIHNYCPKCLSSSVICFLRAGKMNDGKFYDDNLATCDKCGWQGIRDDLIGKLNIPTTASSG